MTTQRKCRYILASMAFVSLIVFQPFEPAFAQLPVLFPSQIIEAPADTPPDVTSDQARFGRYVSIDGDTAVIGVTSARAAYIYSKNRQGDWVYRTRLEIPEPHSGLHGVELSGDIALVAAQTQAALGAVFVFQRRNGNWKLVQTLLPAPGDGSMGYGDAIDFDGRTAVVSAAWDRRAVYVYTRSEHGPFTLTTTLEPNPPMTPSAFGASLAIDGRTILVGDTAAGPSSAGATYVFEKHGQDWMLAQALLASDGEFNDMFGNSVALKGRIAVIGALRDGAQSQDHTGSVYIFVRHGQSWSEDAKLTNPTNGTFGWPVVTDGKRVFAVAGAFTEQPEGPRMAAAFEYRRASGSWTAMRILSPPEPSVEWGHDIDISRELLLTGNQDVNTEDPVFDGQAYEYRLRR